MFLVGASDPNLIPAAITIAILVPAAVIDIRSRRIPDPFVLAAVGALLVTAGIASTLGSDVQAAGLAAGGTAMGAPILFLHLVSPAGMGFGDVKASVILGAGLGTTDWRLGLIALTIAAGIGALVGLGRRLTTIAFGPFLVFGAWLSVIAVASGLTSTLTGATP